MRLERLGIGGRLVEVGVCRIRLGRERIGGDVARERMLSLPPAKCSILRPV